jgi:quercetin dioxygenase-like cupin family protein
MTTSRLTEDIMCQTKSGNKIYWMITSENGAPSFELRYIEIPPGGKSSKGHHPHEHEVFVPGDEEHQWINISSEPFGFVCVVPKGAEAESKPPCGK